jgi:uncharacterized protein DUF1579
MRLSRLAARTVFVAALTAPAVGFAQAGGQQAPPMPKPGPEHQLFKMDAGTWDAAVEIVPAPGVPPMTSKGVEVNTIGCGGLCMVTDFKAELMPGVPFHGHGLATWDAVKKKYAGSWTDSMSQGLAITEATWDPAKKQIAGWMEGPDMTGRVVKTRSVGEYREGGTRVFTAYAPGPDGKEMQVMRITYTRRK